MYAQASSLNNEMKYFECLNNLTRKVGVDLRNYVNITNVE